MLLRPLRTAALAAALVPAVLAAQVPAPATLAQAAAAGEVVRRVALAEGGGPVS